MRAKLRHEHGSEIDDAPREHVEQRDGLDALVDDRNAGADLVEHGVERPARSTPTVRRRALVRQDEDLLERGLDARVDLGDVEVVVLDVLGLDRLRRSAEAMRGATDPVAELAAEQVRHVVLTRHLEDEAALEIAQLDLDASLLGQPVRQRVGLLHVLLVRDVSLDLASPDAHVARAMSSSGLISDLIA